LNGIVWKLRGRGKTVKGRKSKGKKQRWGGGEQNAQPELSTHKGREEGKQEKAGRGVNLKVTVFSKAWVQEDGGAGVGIGSSGGASRGGSRSNTKTDGEERRKTAAPNEDHTT